MAKKQRKALGFAVPCTPGKHHRVSMATGICRFCEKYIKEPIFTRADLQKMQGNIADAMH